MSAVPTAENSTGAAPAVTELLAADIDWAQASADSSALVRHFEETFDVNRLKFRGIHVWPRLRSMMTFAYSDGLFEKTSALKARFGTLAALRQMKTAASDKAYGYQLAEELNRAGKKNAGHPVAFLGRKPRQTQTNEPASNILFDPLIELARDDGTQFIRFLMGKAAPRALYPHTVVSDLEGIVDLLARFEMAHDLFTPPPASTREIEGIDDFVAALPQAFAAKLSVPAIVKDMAFIERLATALRIYLEAAKPPVVLLSGQRRLNMAMILAAHQLGIPTVDIQHGASVYSPVGYKWHSWLHIPDGGYELLPDYFWVWGEQAAANIRASANPACPHHQPIVGGHPALLQPSSYIFDAAFKTGLDSAAKRLLVTLGHLDRNGLPEPLLQAMAAAPKDWRWLLRLHPRDAAAGEDILRSRLEAADIANAEFRISSEAPLATLLREIDWHVTPYSSSAVEASAFGVPTLYVDSLGKDIFGHFLALDGFYYADQPQEILDRLSQAPSRPASLVQTDASLARQTLAKLAAGKSPL